MKKSFLDEFEQIRATARGNISQFVMLFWSLLLLLLLYEAFISDEITINRAKIINQKQKEEIRFSCDPFFFVSFPFQGFVFFSSLFSLFFQFGGFARDEPKFIKLESLFLFTPYLFYVFYLSIASFFIRFSFIHPLVLLALYQFRVNKNVSLFYVFQCLHVYFH